MAIKHVEKKTNKKNCGLQRPFQYLLNKVIVVVVGVVVVIDIEPECLAVKMIESKLCRSLFLTPL